MLLCFIPGRWRTTLSFAWCQAPLRKFYPAGYGDEWSARAPGAQATCSRNLREHGCRSARIYKPLLGVLADYLKDINAQRPSNDSTLRLRCMSALHPLLTLCRALANLLQGSASLHILFVARRRVVGNRCNPCRASAGLRTELWNTLGVLDAVVALSSAVKHSKARIP